MFQIMAILQFTGTIIRSLMESRVAAAFATDIRCPETRLMNPKIRTPAEGIRYSLFLAFLGSVLLLNACMVGPKYQRPTATVPVEYKEPPPDNFKEVGQWKPAEPNDGTIRGKWWEIFNDPELNELEEQVNLSNQNILAAEAQFRGAREAVRITRSGLFPTVSVNPSIISARTSTPVTSNPVSGVRTAFVLPFEISYLADIWGSIRRSVTASAESAQVSAAQLENARLAFHAELARLYFELRGVDGDRDLLESTVKSYEDYLHLTEDRFNSGVASGGDVAQAQTQLETARAQLIDLGVARAQFEHAIAILIGKPPSALAIPHRAITSQPPSIPVGVPSTLLERRPDIAGAERQMASANEQIGIAKAAYYPTLTLLGSAGLASTDFTTWFTWPSRLWSVGPQMAETLFDAGKRHAQVGLAQADYDTTVANYRQTVLTGFQQVEDNLATLRILENEARVEEEAVRAAKDSLNISTYQYKGGTASYLQVIISQTIAFQNERSSLDILARRMVASVLLIEALGGGWDASKLPTTTELVHGK